MKFLYRDTNASESVIEMYKRGEKLFEPGFTDATQLRSKPQGTLRFCIASSRAKDLTSANESAKQWGMAVLDKGTTYGVVDVYKTDGVTQVLLITDVLKDYESLIFAARQDLHDCMNLGIESSLDDAWFARVKWPVGISDDGRPFPVP